MKTAQFIYRIDEKDYVVHVIKRHQRNIRYTLKADGFHVSCPFLVSQSTIIRGLDKFALKLIKAFNKSNSNYSFDEDYIYFLGDLCKLSSSNILGEEELEYYLKKKALEVITELVRKNEAIMGIKKPYKVSIRKTSSQFGSNSKKTHTLSFQLKLIHYSKEIIETVVIHELAHEFVRNHQKEFYDIVYKYSPNYDELQRKLKKGIHK